MITIAVHYSRGLCWIFRITGDILACILNMTIKEYFLNIYSAVNLEHCRLYEKVCGCNFSIFTSQELSGCAVDKRRSMAEWFSDKLACHAFVAYLLLSEQLIILVDCLVSIRSINDVSQDKIMWGTRNKSYWDKCEAFTTCGIQTHTESLWLDAKLNVKVNALSIFEQLRNITTGPHLIPLIGLSSVRMQNYRARIHTRDQDQVEPKISSNLV